jgi:glycosyl transferase, family 25
MQNPKHSLLPPVWVVNLERSPARRAFMEKQLSGLGLKFSFFLASNGQKLTRKERSLYSPIHALISEGRLLAANEIGCALTHARIYQKIVEEKHHEVLILEDDVQVNEDLLCILERKHAFPADWDLINFRSTAAKKSLENPPVWKIYRFCRFVREANGTVAYLIRYAGAVKMLKHIYPIRYPADGMLGRTGITGLVTYGIQPEPVALADFPSDIWPKPEAASWNKSYWRFTMRWVRKIKRILQKVGS